MRKRERERERGETDRERERESNISGINSPAANKSLPPREMMLFGLADS